MTVVIAFDYRQILSSRESVFQTKKALTWSALIWKTGNDLGFQLVSKQVFSALVVFTSVFGMRTGVTPLLKSPVMVEWTIVKYIHNYIFQITILINNLWIWYDYTIISSYIWSSPLPISITQLHALLHFHLWPINLVFFKGYYWLKVMGYLILWLVSRLDAFSIYPFRTSLPCHATGVTTGAQ